jgi:[acyl-carrier-protein] S-malonyltransferase
MKPAADLLAADLDKINFNAPKFPVYSNFMAQKITDAETARQCLKDQVCGTVKWTSQMKNIISNENISTCIEFGPGGVLTKLMKRIDSSVKRYEVYDSESLILANSNLGN